jgi:hypothetical protein
MTPAPARSHRRTHARKTVAPPGPRRISGPVGRVATAGASLSRSGRSARFSAGS